jgi:hypothetical protein
MVAALRYVQRRGQTGEGVMVMNVALPLLTALASFSFAALVLDQWRRRRRSFQLVWGLGLVFYGIGAATEFAGSALGWNEGLYRAWYLFGALFVAAYLGAGTVYLLVRAGFGYFVAVAILLGGFLAVLVSRRYPGSGGTADVVLAAAAAGALTFAYVTARRRPLIGHAVIAFLLAASLLAGFLVMTAPLAAPGYALDPQTHAPVGSAFPGYVRVLSAPFNLAGALCLVFGALFSAYVYMPKRKLLRNRSRSLPPVVAQAYAAVAVIVNLVASLPRAVASLLAGRLNSRVPATLLIALGGFVPAVTTGLDRFGITWSLFLGQLLGVLFIFAGFLVSEEVFKDLRLVRPAGSASAKGTL